MSVLPAFQNKGIGSLLVEEGLEAARRLGHGSVIVVGHPRYYPRFGFEPAKRWGLRAPFKVPEDAFLALELQERAMPRTGGAVTYPKGFEEV